MHQVCVDHVLLTVWTLVLVAESKDVAHFVCKRGDVMVVSVFRIVVPSNSHRMPTRIPIRFLIPVRLLVSLHGQILLTD